jgi:hypothetical protein
MKVQDILESVSSIIYHATPFKNAAAILKSNLLIGREGVSFTRSLTGAYHKENKLIGVIFEVDGNKLNQRLKGKAAGTDNYEHEEFDPDWDDDPKAPEHQKFHGKRNKQLEDRISSHEIPQFNSYIRSAILYLPQEYIDTEVENGFHERYDEDVKFVSTVITYLTKLGIPIRYITSEKQLVNRKFSDPKGFKQILQSI